MRSFLKFGQREGWAKANPAKALRNPRKSRKLPHFLTTDEIGKLLGAPKATRPLRFAIARFWKRRIPPASA